MSKTDDMRELVLIYQTRHDRVRSATAKQFYAGAVHAMQAAIRLEAGDSSDLKLIREVEYKHQKETKR